MIHPAVLIIYSSAVLFSFFFLHKFIRDFFYILFLTLKLSAVKIVIRLQLKKLKKRLKIYQTRQSRRCTGIHVTRQFCKDCGFQGHFIEKIFWYMVYDSACTKFQVSVVLRLVLVSGRHTAYRRLNEKIWESLPPPRDF